MARKVTGFLVALLVLVWSAARAAEQKPWTEVKSPHFRVITDASEHDARDVAAEFEQMRYVFASRFPGYRLESGAPLTIYAVLNYEAAKTLAPSVWKHNENVVGVYHSGWEKQSAIVRMDDWFTQEHWSVYHEYVHSVMHLNSRWMPLWMDEGVAEFYAYTRFQSNRIIIGAPTARFPTLRSRALMPVETLISVDGRSKILHDPETTQTFYADSWALVHYMAFGPNMKGGELFGQFFGLLQQGTPQHQAFIKVFGDFKTFDENWSRYVNRFSFQAGTIPPPPRLDEKSFASRRLSVAETELELGAFHYAFGDRKAGRA